MESKTSIRSDALFSLSAANLAFFKQWSDLTLSTGTSPNTDWNYEYVSISSSTFLGLMLDIVLVAALFIVLLRISRHFQRRWMWTGVHLFIGLTFLTLLNGIRISTGVSVIFGTLGPYRYLLFAASFLLVAYLFFFRILQPSLKLFRSFVMMLLPFSVVTFYHGIDGYLKFRRIESEVRRSPGNLEPAVAKAHPRHRVIVNLFDELDYRVSFQDRPSGVAIPELTRWKNMAWFAQNAHPPGPSTAYSIPSFLLGERLVQPLAFKSGKLVYSVADAHGQVHHQLWAEHSNLFKELRKQGVASAMIGWYLPYCRMFRSSLDRCVRFPHYNFFKKPYTRELSSSMGNFFAELAELRPSRADYHRQTYEGILAASEKAIVEGKHDFIFVHWPVPHAPWIYSAEKGKIVSDNTKGQAGYFDNLALMDLTLKRQRELLQSTGGWEETAVVVMSDHGWITSADYDGHWDDRTPFVVKLPHQQRSEQFYQPFNTIIMKDIAKAILDGSVSTPGELSHWVSSHSGEFSSAPNS